MPRYRRPAQPHAFRAEWNANEPFLDAPFPGPNASLESRRRYMDDYMHRYSRTSDRTMRYMRTVKWLIVYEWHRLAGNRRMYDSELEWEIDMIIWYEVFAREGNGTIPLYPWKHPPARDDTEQYSTCYERFVRNRKATEDAARGPKVFDLNGILIMLAGCILIGRLAIILWVITSMLVLTSRLVKFY